MTRDAMKLHYLSLEMKVAVGDRYRLGDETWVVDAIFHNGIERAVLCSLDGDRKSVARFPIAALVRTADKIEARARRAA